MLAAVFSNCIEMPSYKQTPTNYKLALGVARRHLSEAAGANPDEEMLASILAVDALRKVCGPFHIELYKARGQLMTASLLAGLKICADRVGDIQTLCLFHWLQVICCFSSGDFHRAVDECLFVVGFLHAILKDVPVHPLLGLQLFTLGISMYMFAQLIRTLIEILIEFLEGDVMNAAGGFPTQRVCNVYERSLHVS